jgi:hypothetical protein
MTVHFYIHLDITKKEEFDPDADLANLHDLLKEYIAHSPAVSKKHGWRRRRAIVHLDHFVLCWSRRKPHLIIGAYLDLVKLMAEDNNTDWEIHYYVPTSPSHAEFSIPPVTPWGDPQGWTDYLFHEVDIA